VIVMRASTRLLGPGVGLMVLVGGTALGQQAMIQPATVLEARTAEGEDPGQAFHLTGERVDITVDRQYATFKTTQTWQNETPHTLEGRFVARFGEGAQITGFAYWNGERKIVGEVFEKEVAQEVYADVTGIGRDPGLFEQLGEGAFSFRVFPITAGENKRVEVSGGRYLPLAGDRLTLDVPLAGGPAEVVVRLGDDLHIDPAQVTSPTHQLDVSRDGNAVVVRTSSRKASALVLHARLARPAWTPRLVIHKDAGQDAYAVLSMTAPQVAKAGAIAAKDVTIVLDHSGSMEGEPMEQAKKAAASLVGRLRPGDRVNVIRFDDDVDPLWTRPRALDDKLRAEALAFIADTRSDGGTDIARALAAALAAQHADQRPHVVLFFTDGQSDSAAALAAARKDQGDARVFTVGIGSGVEKPLLARLASEKRGRFTFIASAEAIDREVGRLYDRIDEPVLVDVKIEADGLVLSRTYPRSLPDLARGEELVVAGRLRGEGPVTVTISGLQGGKPVRFTTTATVPREAEARWAGRLWAQSRVGDLLEEIAEKGEDKAGELKNEAIELALAYALVTPYTSFLAIPEEELTDTARATLADARARRAQIQKAHKDALALSRQAMPPGDPILSVRAPRDARQVTARFPFGLVKDLEWDAAEERWSVRFLVPVSVPDGLYQAEVVIVHRDGTIELGHAEYTIDSSAPDFVVELVPLPDGSVYVEVTVREAADEVTVLLVGDGALATAARTTLEPMNGRRGRATVWSGVLLPGQAEALRVVVADAAHNEADQLVPLAR
jgi:Ca-activated chloride channel family protein